MTVIQTHDRPVRGELDRILHTTPYVSRALVPVVSTPPVAPSASPTPPADITTVLRELGIATLGVQIIPTGTKRLTVDGQRWKLTPLKADTTHPVPPSVAQRAMRAQAVGIPFQYWLAAEQPPSVRRTPPTSRRRAYDPILLGILPLGDGRGLFCSLGAWDHPQPTPGAR